MNPNEKQYLKGRYRTEFETTDNYDTKITCIHMAIEDGIYKVAAEMIGQLCPKETTMLTKKEAADLWGRLTKKTGTRDNLSMAILNLKFKFKPKEVEYKSRGAFYKSTAIYRLAQATVLTKDGRKKARA